MTSSQKRWTPSSKRNPCPICGRFKDGDCRISADGLQVICHYGQTFAPPPNLIPGEVVNGWAFTGKSSDGRTGHFTVDKGQSRPNARPIGRKVVPLRRTPQPAPISGPITLAQLPNPAEQPPEHLPHGTRLDYSSSQWAVVQRTKGDKSHLPHHLDERGKVITKAGPQPWPLWRQEEALEHGSGSCIAEAEGEKCADWLRAGGLVAISQPGHAHKVEQVAERYRGLKVAGVAGVVYLADNDDEGQRRASQAQEAAALAQLPLLVLPAIEIWSDLPIGGSIDDAPGTPAERVAALVHALPQMQGESRQVERELTVAERINEGIEGLLQATLVDEHNEIDASFSALWRLGVSRERAQERLLMLWAERHGYNLSPGGGNHVSRGRMFGKAKEGAGLQQQLPGFLIDHELHLVVGTAFSGKTLTTAELATVMSARDRGFLDHEAPRTDGIDDPRDTVLVIASDGEGSAFSMWENYLQDLGADERGASIEIWAQDDDTGEQAWNVSLRHLDRLVRRLDQGDVCLVVMDTANSVFRGAGVNSGIGPIETYLRLLKQIVCRHCALLLTHHTNRSGTPDLKGIGGHPAFQEVPSVIHLIEVKRQADGSLLRLWHVLKLRGSNYRRFAYELRDGRLVVTEGHLFENCDEQVLVALHTQMLIKAGTAPGELIRVTGRPPQSVYNALDRLRGAKLVRRHGNGYRLTPSGQAVVDGLRV